MPRSIVSGVTEIALAALLLAGCGGGSSTPPVPVAQVDQSSLAFGSEQVGLPTTRSVTVSNAGTAALSLSGISLTGADAAMFSQTSTCAESVGPGQSCVVRISFKPTRVGDVSAALELTTNAKPSPTVALSGTGTLAPTPKVLYAVADSSLFAFSFDASGKLSPVPGSPFAAPSGATFHGIAISNDSKFLYSVNRATGDLLGYSIGSDGSLSALPAINYAFPDPYYDLVAHPSAGVIYGFNDVGDVRVLSIDAATGAISETSAVTAPGIYIGGAAVMPDGQYLYSSSMYGIDAFSLDVVSGALTPVPGSPFPAAQGFTPAPVVIDPTGRFLYAINAYQLQVVKKCCVIGLQIDKPSGAVRAIPGVPHTLFDLGGQINSVSASMSFLIADINLLIDTPPVPYYSDSCVVGILSIDPASGVLTPVPGSPFANLCGTKAMQSTGPYVYIADEACSAVTEYFQDQKSGALTALDQSPLSGKCISSMAIVQ